MPAGHSNQEAHHAALEDPRSRFYSAKFPQQEQDQPATTDEMTPAPDHGETTYRGTGRLDGHAALITGVTPASVVQLPLPTPVKVLTLPSSSPPKKKTMQKQPGAQLSMRDAPVSCSKEMCVTRNLCTQCRRNTQHPRETHDPCAQRRVPKGSRGN